MTWVRIDDHFYDHPKWADASGDSIALWLAAMAWCNRNESYNGFIPANKLHGLVSIRNVKTTTSDLVKRSAFHRAQGGYMIHEFAEYQQNEKVQRIRETRRANGRKGAQSRWKPDEEPMANAMANEWQEPWQTDGKQNAPLPTTHYPLPTVNSSSNDYDALTPDSSSSSSFLVSQTLDIMSHAVWLKDPGKVRGDAAGFIAGVRANQEAKHATKIAELLEQGMNSGEAAAKILMERTWVNKAARELGIDRYVDGLDNGEWIDSNGNRMSAGTR